MRHSCAMYLLQAKVDTSLIALWLGHADPRSTDPYIHADLTIKERALAMTTPRPCAPAATSRTTTSSPSSRACDYADMPPSRGSASAAAVAISCRDAADPQHSHGLGIGPLISPRKLGVQHVNDGAF